MLHSRIFVLTLIALVGLPHCALLETPLCLIQNASVQTHTNVSSSAKRDRQTSVSSSAKRDRQTSVSSSAKRDRQTTLAPPFVSVIEVFPYGAKVRALLAPATARDVRRIEVKTDPTSSAKEQISSQFSRTSNANVWEGVVYTTNARSLSLSFQITSNTWASSNWSQVLNLKLPAPPRKAPAAPSSLQVSAKTPFAYRLQWQDHASTEYGFEIQRCAYDPAGRVIRTENQHCVLIAQALPNTSEIVIGGFLPGTQSSFRIRAMNPAGASAWVGHAANTARIVRLENVQGIIELPPADDDDLWDKECTTLAALRSQVAEINLQQAETNLATLRPTRLGKHLTWTLLNPADCGTGGCLFSVYADAQGCLRQISYGFREAIDLGGDWPILVARWHSGGCYVKSYEQFQGSRYRSVDASDLGCVEFPYPMPNAKHVRDFNPMAYGGLPKVKELSEKR
jgi:hypothetical protein